MEDYMKRLLLMPIMICSKCGNEREISQFEFDMGSYPKCCNLTMTYKSDNQ